ncbi:hypothetical protein EIB71_07890 [Kaistella daneshvariae]|uniref:BACON domain-containing protein n=1 Tax=Kaistella daneshvariae TaxID=2487074 RepID=A0ABN5SYW2_9FLAO|nr:hypothetical protein [Kaistella daneshvariae]AZI67587.1 hypothetical protein EIB71_07890 [Kaistella daneshvariae]
MNIQRTKRQLRKCGKKLSIILCFLSISLLLFNCREEEKIVTDEYYIKYSANSSTIYSEGRLSVNYLNEKNEMVTTEIPTKKVWEVTVGPVKKGYSATLTVSQLTENYGRLKINAQIFASKNNGPFAIKKDDTSNIERTNVSLNYFIDF